MLRYEVLTYNRPNDETMPIGPIYHRQKIEKQSSYEIIFLEFMYWLVNLIFNKDREIVVF